MKLFKLIEENLIVLKPILDQDGLVDYWSASYRHVDYNSGQNLDYIDPSKSFLLTQVQASSPKEAVKRLLQHKRINPVLNKK